MLRRHAGVAVPMVYVVVGRGTHLGRARRRCAAAVGCQCVSIVAARGASVRSTRARRRGSRWRAARAPVPAAAWAATAALQRCHGCYCCSSCRSRVVRRQTAVVRVWSTRHRRPTRLLHAAVVHAAWAAMEVRLTRAPKAAPGVAVVRRRLLSCCCSSRSGSCLRLV